MTISIQHVTAGYNHQPVIQDVTFSLDPGSITGLIGLNGAGKSTTIKAICGDLPLQAGQVTLGDFSLQTNAPVYRQHLALIPETPLLYQDLTFREHLALVAKVYQQDRPETWDRAMALVEDFHLTKQLDFFPAYFSKGMKQKVLIVAALMLDLPFYIVDEPFLGLDPLGIRTLLAWFEQKKKEGASLLVSTHVLDRAEKFCDQFLVLHQGVLKGRLLAQDLDKVASLEDWYFDLTGDVHVQ